MTGTIAFDAKDALYNLFVAEQAGDGEFGNTEVWYGFKGRSMEMPREVIWIGEIEWDSEEPAALGALRRVEEFRIMIGIEVHLPGDDQKEVNDRLEVLITKVEELLRGFEIISPRTDLGAPAIDLPAVLRRHPQVCLIDGLAYRNPPGSAAPGRVA